MIAISEKYSQEIYLLILTYQRSKSDDLQCTLSNVHTFLLQNTHTDTTKIVELNYSISFGCVASFLCSGGFFGREFSAKHCKLI